MTKVLFMFVLLVSCVSISAAPQQTPTLQQLALCKADREAWLLEVGKDPYLKDLSWKELDRRSSVAEDCDEAIGEATGLNRGIDIKEIMDPTSPFNTNPVSKEASKMAQLDYRNLAYLHQRIMIHRMKDFMNRHHSAGQFMDEDERGVGR